MIHPWTLSPADIRNLQAKDVEFTSLMNDLLAAATAMASSRPRLRMNLKTSAPDGGVDTAVDGPMPADLDPANLLSVPTCWQFKARKSGNIMPTQRRKGGQERALRDEICAPHCRDLIANGYGYRFCVADSMAPDQVVRWESWLRDESLKINPNSPHPMVVTADLIARWCSQFPGIVRKLRPFLGRLHDFGAWDRLERAQAPNFVASESRRPFDATIRQFADFALPVGSPVLTVSGEAGIGKTRSIVEAIRPLPGTAALLIATDDVRLADEVLHLLLNDRTYQALFVVDGMDTPTRTRIANRLAADANRIRLIAIDNERREDSAPDGEVKLPMLQPLEVDKILEANFPQVPNEYRWSIARLTDGFLRLGVDICKNFHLIEADGDVGNLVRIIQDQYLTTRLNGEHRTAVELISLLARVGYRAGAEAELHSLCAIGPTANLTPARVAEIANELKRSPGFIAVGARYLYVTPRVLAQAAFRAAWDRWVAPDPQRFLTALPPSLQDSFLRQLRDCGTAEAKSIVANIHDRWAASLSTANINGDALRQLLRLVEVEPDSLLPRLCDLIEALDTAGIKGILSDQGTRAHRSLRRGVVWLMEELLRFPEYYEYCERILFRLANAETEGFVNNSSSIWSQIFRPFLSGTSIPFLVRLKQLERRIKAATSEEEIRLCIGALEGPLTADGPVSRMSTSPTVSGRMPPQDWLPATNQERQKCWQYTASLVSRLAHRGKRTIAEGVIDKVIERSVGLMLRGYLSTVIDVVESRPIDITRKIKLLKMIDLFFDVYCRPDQRHASEQIERSLTNWKKRLSPRTLPDRLHVIIGGSYHDIYTYYSDHGDALIAGLACELLRSKTRLTAELPWLFSEVAQLSIQLGIELGKQDKRGVWLCKLASAAIGPSNFGLLAGYLAGFVNDASPGKANRVEQLLDKMTPTHPELVFQLLKAVKSLPSTFQRAVSMVDQKLLPISHLRFVFSFLPDHPMARRRLTALCERLLIAAAGGDGASGKAAIDLLITQRHRHRQTSLDFAFDVRTAPVLQRVLETNIVSLLGEYEWKWKELFSDFWKLNPLASIRLLISAASGENYVPLYDTIESYLAHGARQYPKETMTELGNALLAERRQVRLGYLDLSDTIAVIPLRIIKPWLKRHKLDGARAIARLLPSPHLADTVPVVPRLTEFVLESFGNDSIVYHEFLAGTTSNKAYSGDIAKQYESAAAFARAFRRHRCRWIRKWAGAFERDAKMNADWFRASDEEISAP